MNKITVANLRHNDLFRKETLLKDFNRSLSNKKWLLKESYSAVAEKISQKFNEPSIIAQLLANREVSIEDVAGFLNPSLKESLPDPFHLIDMDKAVERIIQAIHKREKIVIFGDFDVDGATSSALFYRFFQQLGIQVDFYIPDRVEEGYGPNIPALTKLKAEKADLVITVDCGATAFEPLEAAHSMGLDVVVIDHHAGEPRLPKACAVVNPNRVDEDSAYGYLAAVGVSFLTVVAVNKTLREQGFYKERSEPKLLDLLDLVALGTVCDVMPLVGLNRVFTAQGLKIMRQRKNEGLRALSDQSQVKSTPKAYHLGFVLGPRINAGGRVGRSHLGATLLSTNQLMLAQQISIELDKYNEERKAIEDMVRQQAFAQVEAQEKLVLVAASRDWHPGVIGIVAGRLKEMFYKPCLVISIDEHGMGKGSGRSIPGINLGELVHRAKQQGILEAGGGHAMAAGFSLQENKIQEFQDFLHDHISQQSVDFTQQLKIDCALSLRGATADLIHSIGRLEPFGQGNPTPKFLFTNVYLAFAKVVGENHIKCSFKDLSGQRLEGIAFRAVGTPLGDALQHYKGQALDIVGTISLNEWNGQQNVNLTIDDIAYVQEDSVTRLAS